MVIKIRKLLLFLLVGLVLINVNYGAVDIRYDMDYSKMIDGCNANISFTPNSTYPLEICINDGTSDISGSCKTYDSGVYNGTSILSPNNVTLEYGKQYRLKISWQRISYFYNSTLKINDTGATADTLSEWLCEYASALNPGPDIESCHTGGSWPTFYNSSSCSRRGQVLYNIDGDCNADLSFGIYSGYNSICGYTNSCYTTSNDCTGNVLTGDTYYKATSSHRIYEGFSFGTGSDASGVCTQLTSVNGRRVKYCNVCNYEPQCAWYTDGSFCNQWTYPGLPGNVCADVLTETYTLSTCINGSKGKAVPTNLCTYAGSNTIYTSYFTINSSLSEIINTTDKLYSGGTLIFNQFNDTITTFSQNATNTTIYYTNDNVMFNITINDADGFDSAIFSLKNSSGADWYNYSALRISGTSYDLRYNITISSSVLQTSQWRYYINDSWGVITSSDIHSFIIQEFINPSYQNNLTNFTSLKTSQNGQFNITAQDNSALDTILFSHLESGGSWTNITQRISGTTYDMAFNYTVTSTRGQTFQWKFYINDTSGNWNETTAWNLIVQDTYPVYNQTLPNITINEDSGTTDGVDATPFCLEPDGDTKTFSVQSEDTNKVDVDLTVADLITLTPFPNWNGSVTSTIRCCANGQCVDNSFTTFVTSIDDYMLWNNNMTNFTSIKFNQYGNFNVSVQEEDFIKRCLFSYNNASNGWTNDSWITYSGNKTDLTTTKQMTATYGEYFEWRYYCEDNSGNVYNSSINSIVISNTAPIFTQPIPNYNFKHNETPSIKVNATEPDGESLSFWVNNSILTMTNSTSTLTKNWIGNQNGTYNIKVISGDGMENTTTSFILTITSIPPQFTQLPNDYSVYHNSTFNLTINWTDIDSSSITCKINETLLSITNETCHINGVIRSTNQSYNIKISLDDGYYNNTDIFILTVLNSAPYFISFSPTNLTTIGYDYINLTTNANDSEGDLITYQFYNGTSPTNLNLVYSGTNHSFNLTNLQDTTYYWRVNISDGLDSNLSNIYQYTINTIYPAINLKYPKDTSGVIDSYLSKNLTIFNFTVYDSNGVDTCLLYGFNGTYGINQTLRNPVNDAITENNFTEKLHFEDGNYKYSVWCNDSLSNGGFSVNNSFVIDTTFPSLIISSPTETTYESSTILITFSSTDTNLWKTTYSAYLWREGGGSFIYNNITWSNETSLTLNIGTYTFYMESYDKAYNKNATLFNLTITTPTTVTIISAGGGGGGGEEVVKITCSILGYNYTVSTDVGTRLGYDVIAPDRSSAPRTKKVLLRNYGKPITVFLFCDDTSGMTKDFCKNVKIEPNNISMEENALLEHFAEVKIYIPEDAEYNDKYSFNIKTKDERSYCDEKLPITMDISYLGIFLKQTNIPLNKLSNKFKPFNIPLLIPAFIISFTSFGAVAYSTRKVIPALNLVLGILVFISVLLLILIFG